MNIKTHFCFSLDKIEKRKNRKNDKDVFVELENRVKKDALKERLKSRMEMYMLCRCF
jgi:hypothetical protein